MKYLVILNFPHGSSITNLFKTKNECLDYINNYHRELAEVYTIDNNEFKRMKFKTDIKFIN
jgi:uncharacterized protein YbdZ (MbtH family)